jgi:hypothetical protein
MRVLIVGPWPLERPAHGGQIRCTEIVNAYRRSGHTVQFIGLYDPATADRADYSDGDHPITPAVAEYVRLHTPVSKIAFWEGLAHEPASFERFRSRIAKFRPDLIQFEEPFLWPVVRRLAETGALETPSGRVRILHSSHNVECIWRREFGRATKREDPAYLDSIEALEREIARRVDAICVVSEADRRAFKTMGADVVVVASNGSSLTPAGSAPIRTIRQYLCGQPFALYVSSAHPPNALGLLNMVQWAPRAQLTGGNLVVCGNVDLLVRSDAKFSRTRPIFRSTRFLGQIAPELLAAFYAEANVVIVPRTGGGGSHLKTAEALLSDRPIVATSRAFIGFEDFVNQPGVHIRDDPEAFWRQTDTLLCNEFPKSQSGRDRLDALAWPRTLAPMVRIASELF